MNEEIGRILQLLEKGTISAEEAERLIRAAGEAGAGSPRLAPAQAASGGGTAEEEARIHIGRAIEDFWDPFSPFANPLPDIGDFSRAFRRVKDRIRRHNTRRFWWSYFRLNQWYERRRSQRRESMSVYERVRFVLLGAPASGDFILQAQTDIHELLDKDRLAWDLFQLGLEEEFGFAVAMEQARSFRTVQDVVDYVEQRRNWTEPASPASSGEAVSQESLDRPEPDELAEPVTEPESNRDQGGRKRGGPRAGAKPPEPATESSESDDSFGLPPVE